jgi:catechol 2,3-dioxygenase-like lactoylglutathione lyase family enzyme
VFFKVLVTELKTAGHQLSRQESLCDVPGRFRVTTFSEWHLHAGFIEVLDLPLATVCLDCADAHEMARFYGAMLGWEVTRSEPDWVLMRDPGGGTGLLLARADGGVQEDRVGDQTGGRVSFFLRVDDFDLARDFPRYMEQSPRAREWDALMRDFQQSVPGARPGEWWAAMEEVFDLEW